jgi:hypothetical protein
MPILSVGRAAMQNSSKGRPGRQKEKEKIKSIQGFKERLE